MKTSYVIQFDFPEGVVFAGLDRGAWAFAPSLATAHVFVDALGARRVLDNAYGDAVRPWGTVKPLTTTANV